jgi:polyisoprenoid-binding protein YceI
LTLHGQTRALVVPTEVSRSGDRLVVQARVQVRQTDFGIRPASVAGGLVKVRDEVEVTVTVRLAESGAAPR